MGNLYVIGNGFDIAHGIHSKYENFAYFCRERYLALYNSINDEFKKISLDSLWSNFEEGLGCPDIEVLKRSYSMIEHSGRNDEIGTNIIDLKNALKEWVISLKEEVKTIPVNNDLKIMLRKDNKYISFNYTDTLERLYEIPDNNILHIHGYVDSNDKDKQQCFAGYLFGHNLSKNQITSSITYPKNMSDRIQEHIERFSKTGHGEPDVDNQLDTFLSSINQIENVIIIGHSLGSVDSHYFKKLNIQFPNAKWWVSYHGNECKMLSAFLRLELTVCQISFFSF